MIAGKFKIKGQWTAHTSLDAEVVNVSKDGENFVLDVAGAGQMAFSIFDFEDGDYVYGDGESELQRGMKAKVFIFLDANVEDSFKE